MRPATMAVFAAFSLVLAGCDTVPKRKYDSLVEAVRNAPAEAMAECQQMTRLDEPTMEAWAKKALEGVEVSEECRARQRALIEFVKRGQEAARK